MDLGIDDYKGKDSATLRKRQVESVIESETTRSFKEPMKHRIKQYLDSPKSEREMSLLVDKVLRCLYHRAQNTEEAERLFIDEYYRDIGNYSSFQEYIDSSIEIAYYNGCLNEQET